MSRAPAFLDTLAVASPCPASWDAMEGDDRVRYCPRCRQNVYNLTAMSPPHRRRNWCVPTTGGCVAGCTAAPTAP